MIKRIFFFLIGATLLTTGLGGLYGIWFYENVALAPVGGPEMDVVFSICPGDSGGVIARKLEEEGLVRDARHVQLALRLSEDTRPLRAGEFKLNPNQSLPEILETLRSGRVIQHCLTVPEGSDLFDIVRILREAEFLADADAAQDLVFSDAIPQRLGVPLPTAEGLLFPETYCFPRDTPATEVVQRMASMFQEEWRAVAPGPAQESDALRTLLTVASLVEAEAQREEERPLVASVYLNRIERDMRLQADPTVIYSMKLLGVWDGDIKRVDLDRMHPYNTYKANGLPPGPICNPGRDAIAATFNPAETNFLFFVAKKDGGHAFAENYRQHRLNVRKYQLGGP